MLYECIRGHIVTLRGCKTGSKVIWLLYVSFFDLFWYHDLTVYAVTGWFVTIGCFIAVTDDPLQARLLWVLSYSWFPFKHQPSWFMASLQLHLSSERSGFRPSLETKYT